MPGDFDEIKARLVETADRWASGAAFAAKVSLHDPAGTAIAAQLDECADAIRAILADWPEESDLLKRISDELRKWWSFDDRQVHMHTWHDREDFISKVLPKILSKEP